MGLRQDFHAILASLFEESDKPCVKYQPGPSVTLTYPAIVYNLDDLPSIYANNKPYHWDHRYQVMVIDRSPESYLREKLVQLPLTRFSRAFVHDNLYHFVFEIYY